MTATRTNLKEIDSAGWGWECVSFWVLFLLTMKQVSNADDTDSEWVIVFGQVIFSFLLLAM